MRIIATILFVTVFSTSVYAANGRAANVRGYICTSKLAVVRLHEYLLRPRLKFSVDTMLKELKENGYNCSKGRGKLQVHKSADSFLRSDGRIVKYFEFWDPSTQRKLYSWRVEKGVVL